jgi:hypothetical protein
MEQERRRPRHLRVVSIEGEPTEAEQRAITAALEELVDREREALSRSIWRRAGRSQGRRLGMFDYRDRFTQEDAWRLSTRFPFGGREYPGLNGRGDAR